MNTENKMTPETNDLIGPGNLSEPVINKTDENINTPNEKPTELFPDPSVLLAVKDPVDTENKPQDPLPEIFVQPTSNSISVLRNDSMQKITFSGKGAVWTIQKGAQIPLSTVPNWVKQHPDFQSYRRDKMLTYASITAQNRN